MPTDSDILKRNFDQLRRTEPELVRRLEETIPAALVWTQTSDDRWSGTIGHLGQDVWLASRYDPIAEARKLIANADFGKHATVVVLGLGLGYHVAEIARQMSENTLLIVYEPDLALLRAVLAKIDHTAWLARPGVLLVDHTIDRAGILARIEGMAGLLAQGTVLIHHPPTRLRHAEKITAFSQLVTDVLNYCQMHVATALVNSSRTIRNLTSNLAHYVAGANTNELTNRAAGRPAVCVAAGPSLARNVALLRDSAIRQKVVVIAVQTTLKLLLDRGIHPDFVTALDYHEISRRFYEDLPELPDVTLVAEAKSHPSILAGFTGPIRVTANSFLDRLLGEQAPGIQPIKSGATVAHLSLYLAQHLGCDPIIFIGQDLGFSDGLYYCPGTAIHEVWAPELNAFNTVEMMEWQRIVRHRGHLSKHQDIHGRPIYSDEQMQTYLKQFERDFAEAGQTIIDATEGGLPKEHTTRMTLAEALERYATRPLPVIPSPSRQLDAARLAAALDLLRQRISEVRELRRLTKETVPLLQNMKKWQRDYDKATRLYEKIQVHKRRVDELQQTFNLVNDLNTIGVFKRTRADRAIQYASDDPFERQGLQIERDLDNLDWLLQACDESLDIFKEAVERLEHRPELTGAPQAALV